MENLCALPKVRARIDSAAGLWYGNTVCEGVVARFAARQVNILSFLLWLVLINETHV